VTDVKGEVNPINPRHTHTHTYKHIFICIHIEIEKRLYLSIYLDL